MVDQGVTITTSADALVHVSGHPRRDELRQLYSWLGPRIAIPMHGEAMHLEAHGKLAKSLGVEEVVQMRNGRLVRLAPGRAEVIDEAPSGRLYKDGSILIDAEDDTVRQRRKLSFVGHVAVSVVLDGKGEVLADPAVSIWGIPRTTSDGRDMNEVVIDAVFGVLDSLPRPKRRDKELVGDAIRRSIRAAVNAYWDKRPQCAVLVTQL